MTNSKTVTFECPEELYQKIEARLEQSPAHENQSQFLRFAVRQALGMGVLALPPDLLNEIEDEVENSVVFENEDQFVRTAVRTFLRDEQQDFDRAR